MAPPAPTSTRGPWDRQMGKEVGGWHGGGSPGLAAIRVWEHGMSTPFLMVSWPFPQLLICDHSQILTSLFFLQGLCLNEAKLFLTQATYQFKMP